MENIRQIINFVNKVFSIYNINPNIEQTDIKFDIRQINNANTKKIANKIKLSNKKELDMKLYIYSEKEIKIYSLSKQITAHLTLNNISDIISILQNGSRVLTELLEAYQRKIISEIEINASINESIEMSIIAISIGKRQLVTNEKHFPSNFNPLVCSISRMLHALNQWSNRTYEGRKIPFSFLLILEEIDIGNIDKICEYLKDDASALLTDGITSYLEISKKISYKVASYYDSEQLGNNMPIVPYRFSSFGNTCISKTLGIILTVQGDILFVRKKKLIFAKRNNEWHSYDYDAFNETLFKDVPEMHIDANQKNSRIKMIYLTCLDVAFARTGGCLAVCHKNSLTEIKKCINKNDICSEFCKEEREDKHFKREILDSVVINKTPFHNLCRKARQELLGIDGATVILTDGRFVTTGAIMDNNFKTETKDMHGGARTKIAMKLSEFGVAIKISADGYIECYKEKIHIY